MSGLNRRVVAWIAVAVALGSVLAWRTLEDRRWRQAQKEQAGQRSELLLAELADAARMPRPVLPYEPLREVPAEYQGKATPRRRAPALSRLPEVGVPSQGPLIAGAGSDDPAIGTLSWTNPGNITAEDGVFATNGGGTSSVTHYLKSGTHGFSLPSSATVTGIKVELKMKSATATATDTTVKLAKGGTVQGNNNGAGATISTTLQWVAYGGNGDLWGLAWLYSDINASGFGMGFSFTVPGLTDTVSVDAVRITVYYTLPDSSGGSLQKRMVREMGQLLKQNQSSEPILFFMADSTDHITGVTGLSPSVELSKNGGAGGAAGGAVSEVDATNLPGWYQVAAHAADCDTLGPLILRATGTGADPWEDRHQVVAFDPRDAVRMGQTALPDADAEAAGGLFTRGTGAGQVNQDANGRLDANLAAVGADTASIAIIKALYGSAVISGTVNAVTDSGNFTLTSSGLSSNDNDYNNMILVFTSGSNKGVSKVIGSYTGSAKQVQFLGTGYKGAFPETVTAGDSWLMLAGSP